MLSRQFLVGPPLNKGPELSLPKNLLKYSHHLFLFIYDCCSLQLREVKGNVIYRWLKVIDISQCNCELLVLNQRIMNASLSVVV